MRAVLQRVDGASVSVHGREVGRIEGPGLAVLVGVTHSDTPETAKSLAGKVYALRIFSAEDLRVSGVCVAPGSPREVSAADLGLPVLVISQFTLYADTRKGRRPTWDEAAPGDVAEPLVEQFAEELRRLGAKVQTGVFGADMRVSLVNDGPMTVIIEANA
jgi:D-tyrosyl-tRNA(Tyr) deacylase